MAGVKGRSGRPRKPTQLKVIQGTFKKSRENLNEPNPPAGIPEPRKELSKRTREEYYRLAEDLNKMGVLTEVDGIALELCADALAEYWTATEVIDKLGACIECVNKNGGTYMVKRPEVTQAADAWRRAMVMLQQFGLTPSSRGKVSVNKETSKKSKWQEL